MTTLQSYFENCYRHTFTRYQFIKKGATNNSNNFLDHGFEWFVRSERVGGYNIIFEEVSIDEYPWQYCNLQFHPCKEFWIETNKCNWKHSDRSQKSLCHQQTLPSRIYCCDKKLYYYYYYYYNIAVLLFVSQIWVMCVEVSIRFEKVSMMNTNVNQLLDNKSANYKIRIFLVSRGAQGVTILTCLFTNHLLDSS